MTNVKFGDPNLLPLGIEYYSIRYFDCVSILVAYPQKENTRRSMVSYSSSFLQLLQSRYEILSVSVSVHSKPNVPS